MKAKTWLLAVVAAFFSTTMFAQSAQEQQVVINGTGVRLRLEPNLKCDWLKDSKGAPTYLAKGAKLPFKGESGDFYIVEYQNRTLYVSKQYAYLSNGQESRNIQTNQNVQTTPKAQNTQNAQTKGRMVVLNGTSVRLRLGPSTKHEYLKRQDGSPRYLNKGARLVYLGEEGDFYKCKFEGQTVYVSKQFSVLQ